MVMIVIIIILYCVLVTLIYNFCFIVLPFSFIMPLEEHLCWYDNSDQVSLFLMIVVWL